MNTNTFPQSIDKTLLRYSAISWYCMAALGLVLFMLYVVSHYGMSVLDFLGIAKASTKTSASFIEGDATGNFFLFVHLTLAMYVIGGGLLQLLPSLRVTFPKFHRVNGRIFVASAVVCSLAGQYLILTREIPGDFTMDLGTMSAGFLVLFFSYKAVSTARRKKFVDHRRWALRLFLVANAGWFFRIGLMFWLAANQGPVGIDMETFTGPAVTAISYLQFLLPLAVLELYFFADSSSAKGTKILVAGFIGLCAVVTLAGTAAASMMMWFPRVLS